MDQVQESACLSRCVGETRLTINKASNLVQSLRQFQKTVNFDAAPQVLSGLQLSGSTSAPRFISFPLACCAGGQRLRDRRAGIAGVAAHAKSVPRRRRSWRRPSTMPSIIGMWTRGLLIRRHIADGDLILQRRHGARSLAEGASERATASPSSSAERGPGKEPRPTASAPPIDLDPKEQRHHPAGHRRRLKRGRDFALSGTS